MTLIDRRKNCIIYNEESMFYIKPKLIDGVHSRNISHNMIMSYELYKIQNNEALNIIAHYIKYKKAVPDIKISSQPIETFTDTNYLQVMNTYNLMTLQYYMEN